MKTLNAFLRCELPYSERIERLNRICFVLGLVSMTALLVTVLSSKP
jgi:hypothetical protein